MGLVAATSDIDSFSINAEGNGARYSKLAYLNKMDKGDGGGRRGKIAFLRCGLKAYARLCRLQ
jgi:hypothetical protein